MLNHWDSENTEGKVCGAEAETAMYAVFENIRTGERFFSDNCPQEDQTLCDGKKTYRILRYFDTIEQCQMFLFGKVVK